MIEQLFQCDGTVVPGSNMMKCEVDGIDFLTDFQRLSCGWRSQMRTHHVNKLCRVNKSTISQIKQLRSRTVLNSTGYPYYDRKVDPILRSEFGILDNRVPQLVILNLLTCQVILRLHGFDIYNIFFVVHFASDVHYGHHYRQ